MKDENSQDILNPDSVGLMLSRPYYEPPTSRDWYGLGLDVQDNGATWGHTGAMEGTCCTVQRHSSGISWAFILNAWAKDIDLDRVVKHALSLCPNLSPFPSGLVQKIMVDSKQDVRSTCLAKDRPKNRIQQIRNKVATPLIQLKGHRQAIKAKQSKSDQTVKTNSFHSEYRERTKINSPVELKKEAKSVFDITETYEILTKRERETESMDYDSLNNLCCLDNNSHRANLSVDSSISPIICITTKDETHGVFLYVPLSLLQEAFNRCQERHMTVKWIGLGNVSGNSLVDKGANFQMPEFTIIIQKALEKDLQTFRNQQKLVLCKLEEFKEEVEWCICENFYPNVVCTFTNDLDLWCLAVCSHYPPDQSNIIAVEINIDVKEYALLLKERKRSMYCALCQCVYNNGQSLRVISVMTKPSDRGNPIPPAHIAFYPIKSNRGNLGKRKKQKNTAYSEINVQPVVNMNVCMNKTGLTKSNNVQETSTVEMGKNRICDIFSSDHYAKKRKLDEKSHIHVSKDKAKQTEKHDVHNKSTIGYASTNSHKPYKNKGLKKKMKQVLSNTSGTFSFSKAIGKFKSMKKDCDKSKMKLKKVPSDHKGDKTRNSSSTKMKEIDKSNIVQSKTKGDNANKLILTMDPEADKFDKRKNKKSFDKLTDSKHSCDKLLVPNTSSNNLDDSVKEPLFSTNIDNKTVHVTQTVSLVQIPIGKFVSELGRRSVKGFSLIDVHFFPVWKSKKWFVSGVWKNNGSLDLGDCYHQMSVTKYGLLSALAEAAVNDVKLRFLCPYEENGTMYYALIWDVCN